MLLVYSPPFLAYVHLRRLHENQYKSLVWLWDLQILKERSTRKGGKTSRFNPDIRDFNTARYNFLLFTHMSKYLYPLSLMLPLTLAFSFLGVPKDVYLILSPVL